MQKSISVRGAREHNLKNIDLDLPRDQLIVITGLSGSGKSSLAFDTIYAEGQRRYVESLSAYARQFLEMMQKPDVDLIEGLSPSISIEQKTTSRNPRSTVGTVTEIHDYLRLLYARIGIPYSPVTGQPIESQTISQMVDRILEMPDNTRVYLLSPVVRGRKGEYRKDLSDLQKRGFQRVKVDGKLYDLERVPSLNKNIKHDIEVVVDRLVLRKDVAQRLADSLETALAISDGLVFVENADDGTRSTFSAQFACPVSGFTIDEIEPRLFSFNNPFGACSSCDGLGVTKHFDPKMVVPDEGKSLAQNAIKPWSSSGSPYYQQTLESLAIHFGISMKTPFQNLSERIQQELLYGVTKEKVVLSYNDGHQNYSTNTVFEGIIPNMERRFQETESSWVREELGRYQTIHPCESCNGNRLKKEALAVKVNGKHIGELSLMPILDVYEWFKKLDKSLNKKHQEISYRILKEINERLKFLIDVGLQYLTLGRTSRTLSGGESQRIRLASQIGSGLTGVLYVLDEPSIGLHQRDNGRLLETLKNLRDLGNTVIVVEHDEEAIRSADYIVDMGPAAGTHGGKVVACGSPIKLMKSPKSLTAQYLTGKKTIPIPNYRRSGHTGQFLSVKGARANNLKNIDIDIPLGTLTGISGVSGSGKSTLVIETIYMALARHFHNAPINPGEYQTIKGWEFLDKVIDIDQSPIGRTPRSNPATYTGAFSPIREWFSGLPEARARGYAAGRFSFNVKGGRCEACKGDGVIKIEMHFLPDVYVQCDICKGTRYNRETLEVEFKNKTIAEILSMTVDDAVEFFKAIPAIRGKFNTLQQVGLGYIKLGQPATTLSGGEAQRIKLAKELSKRATGRTLYILDEPTTGLHYDDVRKLLDVLNALVNQGNTIIVIEHNLEVLKTVDYIIDLGPEGGDKGGSVVGIGTPETISKIKTSYTGQYLLNYFKNGHQ